jgi:hypothetical protein
MTPEAAIHRAAAWFAPGPIFQCRHLPVRPIPGIERIAGIERPIVYQRRLCMIEVPDIVLGPIFGTALVKHAPHPLLDRLAIMSFRHDVVLMEYMAEKMAIVELV